MEKFIKNYDEFLNFKKLNEKFENLTDVPGLQNVSIKLADDNIEIITSTAKIYQIANSTLESYSKDGIDINDLKQFYENCVKFRYDSFLPNKLEVLRYSESLEIFETDGIMDNFEQDIKGFGISEKDLGILQVKFNNLYNTGHIDNISAEFHSIITDYFDTLLEYFATKIFVLFAYKDMCYVLEQPTSGPNIDNAEHGKLMEENSAISFDLGKSQYDAKANYQDAIEEMTKILQSAVYGTGLVLDRPYDLFTGRNVNSTTIYMDFHLNPSDIEINAILSPVENKKIVGNGCYNFKVISKSTGEEVGWLTNEKQIKDVIIKMSK